MQQIQNSDYKDSIYTIYKSFEKDNIEYISIILSKIIASSILLYIIIVLKNKEKESILDDVIKKNTRYSFVYNKLKDSKVLSVEILLISGILLLIFSNINKYNILYLFINTLFLLILYYLLKLIILGIKNTDEFINNSIILTIFYKKETIEENKILITRCKIIFILFTLLQVILLLSTHYIIYGRYEHGHILNYISDFMIYEKRILLMILGVIAGNIVLYFITTKNINKISEIQKE